MRRLLLTPFILLGACEATAPPPAPATPAAQREVTARVLSLGKDIDELNQRYESLLKQNAAIEKLLGQLGFSVQMSADTVAQRVELMRRFERAEAARTAAHARLQGLLRTLATQHKTEMQVEVRGGQIVVRLAEAGLFDPRKGRLRAEATPLLWAVAEGLKELAGRRFEVVAEVTPPAPAAEPAAKGKKPRARAKAPKPEEAWATSARRAVEVVRALQGAGIAAERLAAAERLPDPAAARAAGGRFIEILVLPTRDELPRVHGAPDTEATPPPALPAPGPTPVKR
jgi:flagellar motor protein MotB